MTEAGLSESATEQLRSRKKLCLWCAAVLVIVGAVTATLVIVISAAVEDEGYGPLEAGEGFALGGPGLATTQVDGTTDESLGKGGVYSFSSLDNLGTNAVHVTEVAHDDSVSQARWMPGGRELTPEYDSQRWRPFPAVVPANGDIQVRLSITRPQFCKTVQLDKGASIDFSGEYRVHWKSRRSSHVTPIDISPGFDDRLRLC